MWYLIDTGFRDPYFNMAYDESLMDYVDNLNTVFLRFFNFSPVSISLGYHQKTGYWLRELEDKGIMWVRRRTGGRAVVHCSDCTYSIVFHKNNVTIGGNVIESYEKISFAFKKAFELLGIETAIERGASTIEKTRNSKMCFSSISLADLCWHKRKIIGSAQYRNKDVVLQQGTIMLKNPEGFTIDSGMATVKMAAGKEIKLNKLKNLITQAFERCFNVSFETFNKNPLKKKILLKYKSAEWNNKGIF
jgi:lipoate-protein ligase A